MSSEEDKILAMVEEGKITAEEADDLLQAIGDDDPPETESIETAWPDLPQRGQAWQQPFNFALAGALVGGSLLLATRKSSGFLGFLRRFILWPFTFFAGVAALVSYFTKDSPWLHLRIETADSPPINISMPVPTKAIHKALQVAIEQTDDEEVREKIEAAAAVLAEMQPGNMHDPIIIDINDEGDHVQIYLN